MDCRPHPGMRMVSNVYSSPLRHMVAGMASPLCGWTPHQGSYCGTVAVIIGGAVESPVRTVLAQFAWMSRLGCVIMLGLGFILIDRQLTPDDPGSSR